MTSSEHGEARSMQEADIVLLGETGSGRRTRLRAGPSDSHSSCAGRRKGVCMSTSRRHPVGGVGRNRRGAGGLPTRRCQCRPCRRPPCRLGCICRLGCVMACDPTPTGRPDGVTRRAGGALARQAQPCSRARARGPGAPPDRGSDRPRPGAPAQQKSRPGRQVGDRGTPPTLFQAPAWSFQAINGGATAPGRGVGAIRPAVDRHHRV